MNKKILKILFVYKQKNISFIEEDLKILSKHYHVTPFHFEGLSSIPKLVRLIKQHDVIFSWFISLHTFFSCFNKKPKIFIAGGYDVANIPSIHYGLSQNILARQIVKYCLKKATKIITVSDFNSSDLERNYNYKTDKRIYNTPKSDLFYPSGKKEDIILTVGGIDRVSFKRKGIEDFCKIAHTMRDSKYQFIVVGKIRSDMKMKIDKLLERTPNLIFTGFLPNKELLKFYQKTKIYLQLSYHEAFGISVAEAMLCECIPIVTKHTALPEVVNNCGFIVDRENTSEILTAINTAYSISGKKCREYILQKFSIEKREKELTELIEETINVG